MTARQPTPLRWTEETEAETMCALARLEREPQSPTVRVAVLVIPFPSAATPVRRRSWPLKWLSRLTYQITRDGEL